MVYDVILFLTLPLVYEIISTGLFILQQDI